ncbi:DnaJ subfamily B member 3 [Phytophthora citrophthora]|uniref:DnaJ subfamily B member 3 n=1 Tax=Phytophthora citrophthora TaxID=4793 RepID=A0AAD9GZ87_9STRA|nr:DnaJ subfamily B member 3 [Phytophthora citrophthora]
MAAQSEDQCQQQQQVGPAWWWRSTNGGHSATRAVTCSEPELLSAAVLCSALSTTKASPSASDALANASAARELEMHVRKSPLPHTLQLPAIEFTTDYVLVESEGAVICAMRATSPGDIVQAVMGSAVPLSQPYIHRFGGSRVHAPFWKRAQRLDLSKLHNHAQQVNKVLLFCGHSIGGSIAKLAFCELVYSSLPASMREILEKLDADQTKSDSKEHSHKDKHFHKHKKQKNEQSDWMQKVSSNEREVALRNLPVAMAVGFGAPYAGNDALAGFLKPLEMNDRVVTFVNEYDCIPGVLNIAHSAAMLAKTTERLVTIAKATKALLNLLPAPMQQRIADMAKGAGTAAVPSATSAYLSMSITMLQKSFDKLREFNVVKTVDYRYAPCGTYIFMAKENAEFNIFADPVQIRKALGEDGDEATIGLTGNSILQHMMSAYVDAIARRSRSIQINATMNHYERLSVARNASDREIRKAYRSLALRWHPDRIAHGALTDQQKEVAEDIFKLLAESYEVLSNQESRRAYDAYLDRSLSRREEFMHYGTVDGITLDEAISTFKDAVDNFSSQLHRMTDRFSSSSSTSVGHSLQHNGGKATASSRNTEHPTSSSGVHTSSPKLPVTSDNTATGVAAAPTPTSQVSSSAQVGPGGVAIHSSTVSASSVEVPASTQDTSIALGKTGDLVANNNAETTTLSINTRSSSDSIGSSSKLTSTSLKAISVVGGAVAVAASVAIIVSAWSQFSDSSRKKRQAAAVRDMPGDSLVLLLEDRKTVQQRQSRTPSIQLLQESKARQIKAFAIASSPANDARRDSGDSSLYLAKETQQAIVELTQNDKEQDEDDKLIDEFFECATEGDDAAIEAMAEEEFFECVKLVQDVDQHFAKKYEKLYLSHGKSKVGVRFPKGSKVNTPFGLGVVEDWRENTTVAAIRFEDESLRYIDKNEITRGASIACEITSTVVEERRAELAERVITKYGLEEAKTGDQITNVALAGAGGAVDSGIRAAGGLALANGVARSGTALGGMVAAPLAVASILVDIGKEFYDYRKKHTERKELGVLSSTSERLMRRDFRLKTGEVVISRTTAAAGAGLGAYGVASAMTMWAAAGVATGPIGIVAATSAAVVGGVAGYFGGAKVYSLSTASYFKSQKHATEHIDRLELGARVLFEEHDPAGTGEISKEACLSIMQKLYEISGDTSDFVYEASVEAIKDPSFEGPVTWRMFWIWVSTEAARSLKSLDDQELRSAQSSEGERKRDKVMRKLREAKQKHHEKHQPVDFKDVEKDIHARAAFAPVLPGEEDNFDDEKAAVEALVHNHHLTAGQAFSLCSQLDSGDPVDQVSAREIIAALQLELASAEPESETTEGFELFPVAKPGENKTQDLIPATTKETLSSSKLPPLAPSSREQKKKMSKPPAVDPRLDAMCSLMSTDGLKRFLETQYIIPEDEAITRHEDLHCLALASAVPPASSSNARLEKASK